MNRIIYSILLAILLTLNLTAVLMAAPTYAPLQAPGVTADIEVLSPLNVTDPLLLGKNISIYLNDCCLLAVIDIQSLEDQGVDVGLVDVLFTPDANWWGTEILKYIDINSTTDGWIQNPATGNWYSIIRSDRDSNTVLLAINLSTIDLEHANVHRESFGDIEVMNLYRKPLWLRIRDYNPPSPPDSALSVNRFAVIKKPDIDWNDYVTVSYSYGGEPRDKAKIDTTVTITISLPDEIKYLLNITGAEPELTFDDFEVINVTMYNLDNFGDSEIILSIIDGSPVDSSSKYLGVEGVSYDASHTVITITGTLQEFAPLAVHEDASFEPKAFYGFHVYLKLNKTSDVGYRLNLTEIGTPNCPNVLDNDTIMFVAEFEGDVTEECVEVWASIEIDATYPNVAYDPSDLNPGDVVKFRLHNVPVPYNDTSLLYAILFDTDYTDIYVAGSDADYLSGESIPEYGILVYNVTLPEGEWGGRVAYVTFIYRSIGYEIRISETPECDPLSLTVYPYADLFVLRNLTEDIVSMDGVIYRKFVHYSETDFTTAPGDYILVKGYGFITKDGVDVYLNETVKLVKLVEINRSVDPGLAPGEVILVLKINDSSTGSVIPPAPDNDVTVTGALYSSTNTYTLDTPLEIGYREDLLKFLVNPGLVYDAIEQTVYVKQTRLSFFDVYYDLVEAPGEPGNDTFVEDVWEEPFVLEVIGMESTDFTVVLVNTYPHGYTYDWVTIALDHGYAIKNFVGEEIPFIAYGLYTIVIENDTDTFVPEAINGSDVFMVHTNLDIDVSSDDTEGLRCDDVTFSIVGGLPDDTLTFKGLATIYIETDMFPGPSAWRTEPISIDISTDDYGIGSVTVSGMIFYDTTELTSDVHNYMDGHSFSGSGSISFTIIYDAVFNYYTNDSLTIWYSHWGTNTEREFILELAGTVNYYEVVDEIDWSASVKIPRTRIVVTVPETIMPGDNITIQIVVHKSDVPHDQIIPEEMWDLLYPYWISVRLVDLSASTGGSWIALYGGWLRFDSGTTEIVLPNGKVAKLVRVLEDVDGDGIDEVVFLVVIPAPITTNDMTLRVDVNITLAYENTGTPTFLDLVDDECTFEANYTGARMWATEYTYVLYGGDDQLTTVLGLLEAKLDYINGTTVYIKGKVDDIWTYITIDLMDFLEAMNNSIITRIDDSTATILTKIGEINASLSDLMMRLASEIEIKIDDSTATIIAKLEDVNETLYLKIDDCCANLESLLNAIYYDLSIKLDSINTTITYYGDTLEMKIDAVNETLYFKIEECCDELSALIYDLETTILSRLDELEANVIYTVLAVNSSIVGHIDVVADDLRYDILLRIDEAESALSDLITVEADEIKYYINDTATTIIATIGESTVTITNAINDAKADLEVYIDGKTSTIRTDIATVKTDTENIIGLIDTLQTSVGNLDAKLVAVNDTLYTLVLSVGDDVKTTITGKAEDILGFLNEFKTATDTSFSDVLSAIDELSTDVETAKTEILANLSSVYSDLSSKLDDVSSAISSARTSVEDKITSAKDELSTKADTLAEDLKKTVEEKTDAVNSNVTTFSLTLLILIVVLIGLVGYSVIAARRVR